MKCPSCGAEWERHRKRCTRCGAWRVSDTATAEQTWKGGYRFPLDIRAALDESTGVRYVAFCAEEAARFPESTRNVALRRAKQARHRMLVERERLEVEALARAGPPLKGGQRKR